MTKITDVLIPEEAYEEGNPIALELSAAIEYQFDYTNVRYIRIDEDNNYVFSAKDDYGEWDMRVDYDPDYDCADIQSFLIGASPAVIREEDMFL